MTVTIVEVIRRSEQGVTEPFVCRGDDENIYFVKGQSAGRESLIKELIVGELAQEFGLPIAPFEILEVPEELVELDSGLNLGDLGFGYCFGSREIPNVDELKIGNIFKIDKNLKIDIVMFDYWVRNGDRTLTSNGGNPNLLWCSDKNELTVIDHNNALDNSITLAWLRENHIFKNELCDLAFTRENRIQLANRFSSAMLKWDEIGATIPDQWYFTYLDPAIPVGFDMTEAKRTFERFEQEEFWI